MTFKKTILVATFFFITFFNSYAMKKESIEFDKEGSSLNLVTRQMDVFYANQYDDPEYDAFENNPISYYKNVLSQSHNTKQDELFGIAMDIGGIYQSLGKKEDAIDIIHFAFKNNWHIHTYETMHYIESNYYDPFNLKKADIKKLYFS